MMVAEAGSTKTTPQQNPGRPPLLPSEKDKDNGPKRPKARQVSSRYLSPSPSVSTSSVSTSSSSSSSRRFPSPLLTRNSSTPASKSNTSSSSLPKRSVSADRRRPALSRPLTPDLATKPTEISAATKLLVTSTRSLSVSFQGETFSLPISKTKAAPTSPSLSNGRKLTPERRRSNTPSKGENSKPIDQQRWPGRSRQGNNPLFRSLDCSSGEKNNLAGFGSGNVIRALKQSIAEDNRRASLDNRIMSTDLGNAVGNSNSNSISASDLTASDTDSVSSGSTSGVQECGRGRIAPRGIAVSARFWQETNSRLRRLQDPGSPLSTSPVSKMSVSSKFIQSKKVMSDSPLSSPRTMASPNRGGIRPSSPSRGMVSPSRVRSTISSNFGEAPSVLSFAVDVRRGKVGENRIVDAHVLRLLYNRHLQWRFVNARTEAALLIQKRSAEKNLWNAWISISDLRDSVTKKRHRLQLMRQKLKLASILKGQITCLEDWASLDKDLSVSLVGAIEALKASTLRLPVGGGAIADVQSIKDAITSSFDVMQAMASSIGLHLSKVEEVNSLAGELAKVTAKERALLEQCKDFLSMLAAMQVKDCSLRTHMLQLNRVPST